ncbi:penicillin-binding protein 2, partial [Candidatus Dojkabacteria bacterium]|nr:penicillin-binding protein 2 [Candidatus Dojkabacteria bacterium]
MTSLDNFQDKKIRVLSYGLVIAFMAAILMLGKWQIVDSERFIAIANERYRTVKIPTVRGTILASDGSTLAYSEPRFDVYVWLPEIELAEKNDYQSREEFVTKVAQAVGATNEEIEERLDSGPLWIRIADKISVDQREELLALRQDNDPDRYLQGLQIEYVNKRIYPEGYLASHVLGFVGLNNNAEPIGVGGIEQYWDGSLKPIEGFESGEFDSFGNPITINSELQLESRPGDTIYTTIDKVLQQKLEQKLEEGYKQYDAKSVTGIIMDPKTGKILAMANYPDYDPNNYFDEEDGDVFGNKAVTVPYEIGSVAKVFTLAASFDSGNLTPGTVLLPEGHQGCEIISPNPKPEDSCVGFESNEEVDCVCTYDKKPVRQSIDTTDALINSDNIAFRHIALSMEYEVFHDYLERFGVGTLTGIDLAGESTGLLKSADQWNYADQAVYSYGHGYQITPLQAITGIAAVANNGDRMQPYIVSKVVDSDGVESEFNPRK